MAIPLCLRDARVAQELGKKAAAVATPHERLLLAQLNSKINRAWHRGQSALRTGRDAEAQPHLTEYDDRMSDALWIWRLLVDRVRGADNKDVTDFWVLPGSVETRVMAVDQSGKPARLSRLMG